MKEEVILSTSKQKSTHLEQKRKKVFEGKRTKLENAKKCVAKLEVELKASEKMKQKRQEMKNIEKSLSKN